jgi:hypothetical protein
VGLSGKELEMPIRQDSRTKRWYYRFYRGRSYFNGGFRTHEQAKEAERRRLNQVVDGRTNLERPAKDLTLAEAGQMFFENHARKNKRSWKSDRARIASLSEYFGKSA